MLSKVANILTDAFKQRILSPASGFCEYALIHIFHAHSFKSIIKGLLKCQNGLNGVMRIYAKANFKESKRTLKVTIV